MAEFTKGPWGHEVAGNNHWIVEPTEHRVIAYIGGKDGIFTATPGTPHEANARFIATAPAMYQALKKGSELLNMFKPLFLLLYQHRATTGTKATFQFDVTDGWLDRCEAAIASAKAAIAAAEGQAE